LRWQKEKEKVMDYNALQHKLFAMDPTDPREDLAKLRAQAGGDAPTPAPQVDYIAESASVPEGSLQMDRNYSVNDFAALAGVTLNEKQKHGDYARGSDPMPKAEPGRTKHPLKDKLVGEEEDPFVSAIDQSFGQGSIAKKIGFSPTGELYKAIYRAIKAIMPDASEQEIKKAATAAATSMEESVNERSLTKGEEKKKEKYVKGMKKSKSDFKDRYGKDAEAVMYATATKMAKEDGKGRTTRMPGLTAQPHLMGLSDPDGDYDDGELRVYTKAYRDMYKKAKAAQAKADATPGDPMASYTTKPRDVTWSSNVFPKLKNPKKPRT
jgi:hypothetical protein